jgi:hypothetical protein
MRFREKWMEKPDITQLISFCVLKLRYSLAVSLMTIFVWEPQVCMYASDHGTVLPKPFPVKEALTIIFHTPRSPYM